MLGTFLLVLAFVLLVLQSFGVAAHESSPRIFRVSLGWLGLAAFVGWFLLANT